MKKTISILLVTILVSCNTTNQIKEKENNTLLKKWELSVIDGKKVSENPPIYLEFTADNVVSGFTGCNRLTGNYSLENKNEIKFNQLGLTRMACRDKEMEMERQILKMLKTTNNFSFENGKLIFNSGGSQLAVFHEMSNHEIVNKYWKLKILEGDSVTMAANQEREQYFTLSSDGGISGFAGCNHFSGNYELSQGNRISIHENLAITMKICPDLDIDESAFLKILILSDNYTLNGDVLFLNVGKRAPLAVFEAVYF